MFYSTLTEATKRAKVVARRNDCEVVVCRDGEGMYFICSYDFWVASTNPDYVYRVTSDGRVERDEG
jgi:hypothetical protein